MHINWFPGHMAKALRTMQAEIKNIDCVIYVLDSRVPVACLNPEFDKVIKDKPILLVLNKIDMADKNKSKVKKYRVPAAENTVIVLKELIRLIPRL